MIDNNEQTHEETKRAKNDEDVKCKILMFKKIGRFEGFFYRKDSQQKGKR